MICLIVLERVVNMNFKKIELYFVLIDIVKGMIYKAETEREIKGLTRIANNLNKLVLKERVK
jgi:hypothetical protein